MEDEKGYRRDHHRMVMMTDLKGEPILKVWVDKLQSHFEAVFGAKQGAWFLHVPQFRRKKRPKWGSRLPFTTFEIGSGDKVLTRWLYGLPVLLLMLCSSYAAVAKEVVPMNQSDEATAIFAGGCFWCMEKPFEHLEGVRAVISGYTAGSSDHPTYQNYAEGGHIEAIKVYYNPKTVDYAALLHLFWRQIDPTDGGGQFVDRGHQYSSAIFYQSEREQQLAKASKAALSSSGRFSKPIVTPILPAEHFYPAEDYHQNYYRENPTRYWYYRSRSGRDPFLDRVWGKQRHQEESMDDLKQRLTPLQYEVTQESGTESPFDNAYWNNKQPGIYVDVVSGEPLFSSRDKFDSGTGWPSFSRPLVDANVVEREDRGWFSIRTEVRSHNGDSHLGHLFNDGPPPTGMRYCINSAALRFIPKEKMEAQGLGSFLPSLEKGQ